MSHLDSILDNPGKKRLLAIDGGGIRGAIAVEVLAEIEANLRNATGQPDLRLADWFHFVAGCSTGAILAAGISAGMEIAELRSLYHGYGPAMFKKAGWWTRIAFHRYVHGELSRLIREHFGEATTLGDRRLRNLLMVILKNASTDSPWPITNNPRAKFNARDMEGCNLALPLWRLIRASTAAPSFFAPEEIHFEGLKKPFVFVDGALTPYNNPAFIMYLTATLSPYRICWRPSADDMLIVSVGTGLHPLSSPDLTPRKMNLLYTATTTPATLMYASINEQDMLCRAFGKCVAGDELDGEIGALRDLEFGGSVDPCFTYVRYNVELTAKGLDSVGCSHLNTKPLHKLDAVELIKDMQEVGSAVARNRVKAEHFENFH